MFQVLRNLSATNRFDLRRPPGHGVELLVAMLTEAAVALPLCKLDFLKAVREKLVPKRCL